MNYKIVDNFLSKEDFLKIKKEMLGDKFPWYYNAYVSKQVAKDGFYFTHLFYNNYAIHSDKINLINPILEKLKPKAIIRIKGNCYVNTHKIIEHKKHVDCNFEHKGFIYYVNTNNGFTRLEDGTKIESIENRGLFFDAGLKHNSATCSDKQVRVNINFNYF